jgi:hypothetical protein
LPVWVVVWLAIRVLGLPAWVEALPVVWIRLLVGWAGMLPVWVVVWLAIRAQRLPA